MILYELNKGYRKRFKKAIRYRFNSIIHNIVWRYILNKIEERNKAKSEKNYEIADSIRNELYDKGIELIDIREGTTYKII